MSAPVPPGGPDAMTRRALIVLAFLLVALAVPTPARAQVDVETVAGGLAFPTNLAFAPDGRLFFTEKDTGLIRVIRDERLVARPFARIEVTGGGEMGLLGIALDPDFGSRPWVYVYYTDPGGVNRLARIWAGPGQRRIEPLLELLPTVGIHNGGDMLFGPDDKLYLVVGDGADADRAQDPSSLGGKVLRLEGDGSPAPDNPFGPDSPTYSLGHRNSFGLCVNPVTGDLWETENGPDRLDEVNIVFAGKNYGWPEQLGPGGDPAFVDPVLWYRDQIVPTGCAFFDRALEPSDPARQPGSTLYVGDFHGDLRRVLLSGPGFREVEGQDVVASFDAGITDVAVGLDGALYVATAESILRIAGVPAPATPPSPTPSSPTAPPTAPDLEEEEAEESGQAERLAVYALAGLAGVAVVAAILFRVFSRKSKPGEL